MKPKAIPSMLAAAALIGGLPAASAEPVDLLAPQPQSPVASEPSACHGAVAERAGLEAERSAINRAIGDIALGRHRPKRKVGGGEVAAGVAGAAASVLLPFGVGALLGAGAGAAAKKARKRKPRPPEPDVPAMIDRLHLIDARLNALKACGE